MECGSFAAAGQSNRQAWRAVAKSSPAIICVYIPQPSPAQAGGMGWRGAERQMWSATASLPPALYNGTIATLPPPRH
ncbi:MAG: hypothetical protein NZQ09_03970 [Chloroflexus sp.]|nr:hypothetical protein [Chloroflexus sp.]